MVSGFLMNNPGQLMFDYRQELLKNGHIEYDTPVAYLMISNMIRYVYAYPVEIGIDIFIYTVSITTFIAFMTVLSQTLKAARSNPVHALKYE